MNCSLSTLDSLVGKVIENIQQTAFIVMVSPTKYSSMTADLFRKRINATTKSHDTEKEKKHFFTCFIWLANPKHIKLCIKLCIKVIKHRTTLRQLQIHCVQLYSVHIFILFSFFFLCSFHSLFWFLQECVLSGEILESSHLDWLICRIFRVVKPGVLTSLLSASVETEG